MIRLFEKLELMGDEDPRLAAKILSDAFLVKMFGDVSIHRAQWIVQQVDICLSINRPGEIDSRSLASGQRHTSVTDYRHVALWKLPEVFRQRAHICNLKSSINCEN